MRTLTEKPSGGWASETSSTVVPAGRSRMGLGAVAAARVIAGRRSDWGLTKRVQVLSACAVRGAGCGRMPGRGQDVGNHRSDRIALPQEVARMGRSNAATQANGREERSVAPQERGAAQRRGTRNATATSLGHERQAHPLLHQPHACGQVTLPWRCAYPSAVLHPLSCGATDRSSPPLAWVAAFERPRRATCCGSAIRSFS
jgi:hypothetical protein